MIEIVIRIKEEDFTISERFLHYDPFTLSKDDPILQKFILDTVKKANITLNDPEIVVKITLIL